MKQEHKPIYDTLKKLSKEIQDDPYLLREIEPRVRWTSQATAALKFNDYLYGTALETSDVFCRPELH